MIGGTDIVMPATGGSISMDICARIVQRYWPRGTFEDALSGVKYGSYRDLPIGRVREFFVYCDPVAEAAWDANNPDVTPNSMLYVILSDRLVTVVVDDPNAPEMQPILDSIRRALSMDILNTDADLTLPEAA